MKNYLARLALVMALLLAAAGLASATTLDFATSVTPGVTLGGNMTWTSYDVGHLFCQQARDDDYIIFTSPTTVNSFQMNAQPWPGGAYGKGKLDIAAFKADNTQLWGTTVDLTGYAVWGTWLTVDVQTANVSKLTFYSPWNTYQYDGYPSVDNMVINEALVPIPGAVWLLGSGLLGLAGLRRKFSR
jgi:hypothetical protein